jgi:Zn-dependent peptidase ImmA (M78 family)
VNSNPFQNLDELDAALTREGLDPDALVEGVNHLREHLERYARLETALLGHVTVSVPRHLLEEGTADGVDPVEALAHRERERLGLTGNDAGFLMGRLDREGLKVARVGFLTGTPVLGFFLFDHDAGPILAVDETLGPDEQDFVFARLYGNFLMDNDPYQIRVASRDVASTDERAARAVRFAAAFLIDREELDRYLTAIPWSPGDPLTDAILGQLHAYFGVNPQTLLARLYSLGYVDTYDATMLAGDTGIEAEDPGLRLPERFVRLALEAYARDSLTLEDLAEHLETDTVSAERLADRFRLES